MPSPIFFHENLVNEKTWDRYKRKIIEVLEEQSFNECVYCESKIGISGLATIGHYYPKSQFPDLAYSWDNLLLLCQACSAFKRDSFPVDENSSPLLIDPFAEDPSFHISFDEETGLYTGLSEKGNATISVFNLNRPNLVAKRKEDQLLMMIAERYPQIDTDLNIESVFGEFTQNISNITLMMDNKYDIKILDRFINNMLYANVITAMETYLSNIFIKSLIKNEKYLRSFVESYPKYSKGESIDQENTQKFKLSEVFKVYDKITEIVIDEVMSVMYHNLKKVKPMFKATFDVDFPNDMGEVYKAVEIRHDIVHRNGYTKIDKKTKTATQHEITKSEIKTLIEKVNGFISVVNGQMIIR